MIELEQRQITENYEKVQSQILEAAKRARRSDEDIQLVVVTKGHPVEAVRNVIKAGARRLGENYVEAAAPKIEQLKSLMDIEWHMIGHIQSRKAREVCENFDYVHSLDSVKLAGRLHRFAAELGITLPVLLECNVSGEGTKYGFPIWRKAELPEFFVQVAEIISLDHLAVHGLMTMAPYFEDAEKARPYFRQLKLLQNTLSKQFPEADWRELSMGMSGDFEVAIEEGATLVRIGTAIMGSRAGA